MALDPSALLESVPQARLPSIMLADSAAISQGIMRRPKYIQVFDWDWSDGFAQESSREQALKNRPKQTRMLSRLCEADNLVHFALWSKLPEHHPVGELWLETQTDLHASIYVAYGGYFRQALALLRLWLEMAVNGVYFAKHYGQRTGRYELWRSGLGSHLEL